MDSKKYEDACAQLADERTMVQQAFDEGLLAEDERDAKLAEIDARQTLLDAQKPAPTAPVKAPKQRSNSAYVFTIVDGKLVWNYPGIGELSLDPSKVSAVNRARAITHGLKQRVIDAAALDAGADGKTDPKAKFAEMRRVIEHLESGSDDWNLKPSTREASGPASYVTQALVALKQYQGRDVSTSELANAFVKAVADAPKLKLGGEMAKARKWLEENSRVIREKIAELRAAEKPAIDADEALGDLLGGE